MRSVIIKRMRSGVQRIYGAGGSRAVFVALGLLALAAGVATSALAASKKTSNKAVVISDGADAHSNPVDITRVSLGAASRKRLKLSVRGAEDFDASDLLASKGPPGSVCVRMWTKSTPPDESPDYLVCVTSTKDEDYRAGVFRERPNQLPRRVAKAIVDDEGDRSFTLLFRQASIGHPKSIDFSGESTKAGCVRLTCIDTAPNAPGVATLKLSTSTSTTTTTTG